MKLNFDVKPGPRLFPYTYGEMLARAVYQRLDLEDHDGLSVHSVSWLWGDAEATSRGLVFSGLQSWSVGLREEDARRLVEDLQQDPIIIEGLEVVGGRRMHPSPTGTYRTESPVLLRLGDEHLAHSSPKASDSLTHSARRKLRKLGLPEEVAREASVEFTGDGKTKTVSVCGNQYKCNQRPIVIDAPPALQEGIMTTGIGGLTGMGLGAIAPTGSSSAND
ncbi:CRISPR-associated endoribonuclease Cas6 [Salinibacter ruber]|jgi:hypothetical protein|uniref:CRISPR-associated endoribonuclease Cas6 n=1 Tax=Salinibacter ruber TaxID=146919 RepID=UPI002169A9A2|nr:CRISPR-associated endoribonuclease Cas6 [Salinibacter ruber]MCS4200678.1 hypothetical protein [Salinibacter ruber]